MTDTETSTVTAAVPAQRRVRETAAERRAHASVLDAAVELAQQHGLCVRPIVRQRLDTETGELATVAVPCGNTLEQVCPSCAKKARALRITQCREGWHLPVEPAREKQTPTDEQTALVEYRAQLGDAYTRAKTDGDTKGMDEIRAEAHAVEDELRASGLRGKFPPLEPPAEKPARAVRSTRRRQDVPDLPRLRIDKRTIGRIFAGKHQPSMFITLTMPSYGRINPDGAVDDKGRVCSDGTPADPDSYDYRRAARDSVHFAALVDRWVQNLRRAVGWNVQYYIVVEPQKRGAPHVHMLIRGTVTRDIIKQVTAATYRQIWWPNHDHIRYSDGHMPEWDDTTRKFVDPITRAPLTGWAEAMKALDTDPHAEPAHVVRFGVRLDKQDIGGVLGGTDRAGMRIGYVTKYLMKSVSEVLDARTDRQHAHHDRLHAELERTPCSPRCPVWLRYGIVPKGATAKTQPGRCKAKAHRRDMIGQAGRRVLNSRDWSGKTLPDHQGDRADFVRQLLADVGIVKPTPNPDRYIWLKPDPGDPNIPDRNTLLLAGIAQLTRWRAEYTAAALARAAAGPPGMQNNSAIDSSAV